MLREKGVYFLRTCCVVARDNSNAWAGVLFGFPAPPPLLPGPAPPWPYAPDSCCERTTNATAAVRTPAGG